MGEKTSRDKGRALKLPGPSPKPCVEGLYPDGPGVTPAGKHRKVGLRGHPEGSGGVRSPPRSRRRVRPGKGQQPRAGEPCGEPRGAAVAMVPGRWGLGEPGPAPSPAGPAPDGPGPPAGAGGLQQGEAIVLLPRRRSPAARARAPPRAPPLPAPRAPRVALAP